MEIAQTPDDVSKRDALKNIFFVLISVGAAYWLIVSVGVEGLHQFVERAGIFAPLVLIVLKMLTIIIVPLSGGPVYAIAGAAFGFWKGIALTFLGDVLGFASAFYLSRFFGRRILAVFIPPVQFPLIDKIIAQGSVPKSFLKARLAFTGFPEVFAYAAGLTKIPFWIFIIAQLALHTPAAMLVVLFGNALLTGNPVFFVTATIGGILLALIGGWWFKRDLVREA